MTLQPTCYPVSCMICWIRFTKQVTQTVTVVLTTTVSLVAKMENGKESDYLRDERIFGTNNGATLRTRVIKNKKAYKRKKKVEPDED